MKKANLTPFLYAVILIEGYVVLSTELLAIRQTVPFVGSGTDTVSIIIAAVLMPLAFGYQSGGRFKAGEHFGRFMTVRSKLIFNLMLSALILLPGLSIIFMYWFFQQFLPDLGIENRLVQITVYCLLFIVTPVYLLGQTIPLVSNYFSKSKLSEITGQMLCFSTIGSFMGAVFSTLVLMSTIGVNNTVSLNFILLALLLLLLSKKKLAETSLFMLAIAGSALFLNSNALMAEMKVVYNNQYHLAQVVIQDEERHLILNNNWSSMYDDKGNKYPYVEFIEREVIDPIRNGTEPKDILIIGAGAFTLGFEDEVNNYIYLDIDPDLQKTAEEHILKNKLQKNKIFLAEEARAFLARSKREGKKFDFIYLDAYLGGLSIPEHLITQEFFTQVKDSLKDKGLMLTNFIVSPNFEGRLSRSIDNTLRSVMPHVSRVAIDGKYHLYNDNPNVLINMSYVYRHEENYDPGVIYTDNKNTIYFDKPQKYDDAEEPPNKEDDKATNGSAPQKAEESP